MATHPTGGNMPDNKNLGTIFNSDINGLLIHSTGKNATPTEYKSLVLDMLDMEMDVLAQNVGLPDPVIYRSQIATTWDNTTIKLSKLYGVKQSREKTYRRLL